MRKPNRVAVVGSLNIDYFTRVKQFPHAGETVMADALEIRFGGKGANQAVAASRLGAEVEMIGLLGDDEMGRAYAERLDGFGIGIRGVQLLDSAASGSAFITLDAGGENTIVVAAGANQFLTAEHVESQAQVIAEADCLLLQNEVPPEANLAAMAIAKANDTWTIYNPAPWRDGSPACEEQIGILIVNEIEAASLLGKNVTAARDLPEGVVVTRGSESTLANIGGAFFEVLPDQIEPVDTVGAGDTFCGAIAARLGEIADFSEILRYANCAAGLATGKTGAQEAMPTAADVGAKK